MVLLMGVAALHVACAWEPRTLQPVPLPGALEIEAGDWGGHRGAVVRTAEELVWVQPHLAKLGGRLAIPLEAVLLEDLDDDGDGDLLVCGPAGVGVVRGTPDVLEAPRWLWTGDCRGLSAARDPSGVIRLAVDGPERGVVLAATSRGLVAEGVEGPPGSRWATDGVQFARVTAEELTFRLPSGESRIAFGGQASHVATQAETWAWTIPEAGVLRTSAGLEATLAGEVSALLGVKVPGGTEWWVAYPTRSMVGVIAGDAHALYPSGTSVTAMAAADLDADGCPDAVWAGADVMVYAQGLCGDEDRVVAEGERPMASPTSWSELKRVVLRDEWLRVEVPVDTEVQLELVDGSGWSRDFEVTGLPSGFVLEGTRLVGRLQGEAEYRVAVVIRDHGTPRKPEAGFTLRAVAKDRPVSVLPEWSADADGVWRLRSCIIGFGGAVGTQWEVGGAVPTERWPPPASPVVTVGCQGRSELVSWYLGGDTAPLYQLPDGGMHLLLATAGLAFGTERVQFGPMASVGLALASVGLSGQVLPFGKTERTRWGFELRGNWLTNRSAVQVLLLYVARISL